MPKHSAYLVICCLIAWSQDLVPGPQAVTFFSDVDGSDQPYGLYLPKKFNSGKRYPLVLMLHGVGSNHRLALRQVFGRGNRLGELDLEAARRLPALPDVDYVVAAPFARGSMGYGGIAERDVYDVLADVKRRFPIDEDRVYLTGLAMGGGGVLSIGLTRPDVWAAIAAVSPVLPPGFEEFAINALNVPVKIFQGAIDPVVSSQTIRDWHERLAAAGASVEYVELPGVRHNAWEFAYKDAAIFEWFSQYRRQQYPERVHFATREYRNNTAYWARFDVLNPGTLATIDARFQEKNKLAITTSALDAFTLTLKGHPSFLPTQPLTLVVDGKTLRVRARDTVSLSNSGDSWAVKTMMPKPGQKRHGLEGPLRDALVSRQVYVYGTGGASSPEEVRRRHQQAAQAAEWSTTRSRLLLSFRVLADTDAKDSDLASANVVLFGTKETNSLVARYAARLPFALNPGAADYGFVYVYPVDGRYIVLSSGLPWWTRIDQVRRSGLPLNGAVIGALMNFGDYVVFKGGLDNVIAEGRFDRDWKLSSAARTALAATGAFEIRP